MRYPSWKTDYQVSAGGEASGYDRKEEEDSEEEEDNLGNDAEATNGTDDVPFLILASQDEN